MEKAAATTATNLAIRRWRRRYNPVYWTFNLRTSVQSAVHLFKIAFKISAQKFGKIEESWGCIKKASLESNWSNDWRTQKKPAHLIASV